MILDCNLLRVEILMHKVAPAPLAIVAISHGAGAHRGVAHKEKNWIVTLTCRPCYGTHCQCLVDTVRSVVNNTIDIFQRTCHFPLSRSVNCLEASCRQTQNS